MQRVRAVEETTKDGRYNLTVVTCPFCRQTHEHGAGSVAVSPNSVDAGFYGERMAHCGKGNYEIVKREDGL